MKRRWPRLVSLFFGVVFGFWIVGSSGCGGKGYAQSVTGNLVRESRETVVTKDFWGIEEVPWGMLDVLEKTLPVFEKLGVGLLGRNCLDWSYIEPNPPRNGQHFYKWHHLDREFRIYHQHGFRVQAVVRSRSSWATQVPEGSLSGAAGSPPKPAHWEDWKRFVSELVERYDGDGFKDGFKMEYPVLKIISIQGEIEFSSHWKKYGGTPENYTRLLRTAYEAAKKANPDVIIARAGTSVGHWFDSEPSSESIAERMTPKARNVLDFITYSLDHPEAFDFFGIHVNRSYRGIGPFVAWLRQQMKSRGYVKPIFIEDASSVMGGQAEKRKTVKSDPASKEREESYEVYEILKQGGGHPRYGWALKRLRQLQAETVVKKSTMALASNVEGIMFSVYLDNAMSQFIHFRYGGFIDTGIARETRDVEKSLKPSYYSLKLFIEKVEGARKPIERLERGTDVYAFCFRRAGKLSYILWCDNREREIELAAPWEKALVTPIVTSYGQVAAPNEIIANNGKIVLSLNSTPVFVEELP